MASVPLLIPDRSSVVPLAGLLLLLTAFPCASEDASFSLSLETDGRKLSVIGNNSLSHDLVCDYEIKLVMSALRPEDRRPSDVQSVEMPQGRVPLDVSDQTLSGIAGGVSCCPRAPWGMSWTGGSFAPRSQGQV